MSLHKCAFISDLDNALLDSNGGISKKNAEAILKFTKMGGHFAINTRKAPVSVHKYIGLPEICHGIFCSGAMIYNFSLDKAVWESPMYIGAKQAALDIMERFKNSSVQIYTANDIFMLRTNPILFNKCVREEHRFLPTPIGKITDQWLKISIADCAQAISSIQELIEANYPQLICLPSANHFIEITDKNTSGETALKAFCELHDIPLKRTIVVSADETGMSMFGSGGISMTVANASKSVLKLADQVLPDHNENAIAHGIETAIRVFG